MQKQNSNYSTVYDTLGYSETEAVPSFTEEKTRIKREKGRENVFVDSESEGEEDIDGKYFGGGYIDRVCKSEKMKDGSRIKRIKRDFEGFDRKVGVSKFAGVESQNCNNLLEEEDKELYDTHYEKSNDKIKKLYSNHKPKVRSKKTEKKEHFLKKPMRKVRKERLDEVHRLKKQNVQKIEFDTAEMSYDTWELKMARPQHGGGLSKKSGIAFAFFKNRESFRASREYKKLCLILRQKYKEMGVSLDEIFGEKIVKACVELTLRLKEKFAKKKVFVRPLFMAVAYRMLRMECGGHEYLIELRDIMGFLSSRDDGRYRTKMVIYYLNQFKKFFVKKDDNRIVGDGDDLGNKNQGFAGRKFLRKRGHDEKWEREIRDSDKNDSDHEKSGESADQEGDSKQNSERNFVRFQSFNNKLSDSKNLDVDTQEFQCDRIKIKNIMGVTKTILGTLVRRMPDLRDKKTRILQFAEDLLRFSRGLTQDLISRKPKNVALAMLYLSMSVLYPFYRVNLTEFLGQISKPCVTQNQKKYSGMDFLFFNLL